MSRHDDFTRLVNLVYAAAAASEKWPAFWQDLARTMHASAATVIVQSEDAVNLQSGFAGGDETSAHLYNTRYARLDPWFEPASERGLSAKPQAYVGDQLLPLAALRRTEFHADFGSRYDMVRPLTIASVNPILFAVSVLRGESAAPWGDCDVEFLMSLEPHVRRAADLHSHLHTSLLRAVALEDAFDRMAVGVVVLDEKGRILFANRAASEFHDAQDGFALTAVGPGASHRALAPKVAEAIAAAIRAPTPQRSPCATLSLERPSGRKPYAMTISAARDLSSWRHIAAVLVLITDPERSPEGSMSALARDYDLTAAEIDVTLALAQGLSIAETADRRHVSVETVRSQVKTAMSKCGARRQSDLVRLVSTLSTVRDQ